jgi:hypothetical protein
MRIAAGLVFLATAGKAAAQDGPDASRCMRVVRPNVAALSDARSVLWRTLTLGESAGESQLFRAASLSSRACTDSLRFLDRWTEPGVPKEIESYPLQAGLTHNSAYPRSVNDAAAWAGVGANFHLTGGVRSRWRFLEISVAPEVHFSQNGSFTYVQGTTAERSEFANSYHPYIDLPERMGNESFTTFAPGQTYVRAGWREFAATIGTENLWIGAAQVHPILMSSTAPGFPHVRVGTQRPLELPLFNVEFQMLFGSLSESDYFDGDDSNDEHYFTTTMVVLQPRFIPGLSLGVARAYHDTASAFGQNLRFYTSRLIETPFGAFYGGNRVGNAIGVLLGRWVQPESRFEAYAEWSREDTPGGWTDVLREPDWTQAYVLGVQKGFVTRSRVYRLYGEMIHLGESAPSRAGRGFFSYYTHSTVTQGHTQRGQLLGSAIGPGSDAQLIGFDMFDATGRSGARIERVRYDDDTYYRRFARRWGETRHDAEINVAVSRTHLIGAFEVEAGIQFSRRYGRDFIPLDGEGTDLVETNWGTRVVASWQPRLP